MEINIVLIFYIENILTLIQMIRKHGELLTLVYILMKKYTVFRKFPNVLYRNVCHTFNVT